MKTYDPQKVIVSFGALILQGFADGTFINVTRNEDTFTLVIGADGKGSRAKTSNKSGRITITLAGTSPSNDFLSAVALEDETITSGIGVLPLLIKDLSGTTTYFAGSSYIVRPPDGEFSKEITNREWMFDCEAINMFTGGNGA